MPKITMTMRFVPDSPGECPVELECELTKVQAMDVLRAAPFALLPSTELQPPFTPHLPTRAHLDAAYVHSGKAEVTTRELVELMLAAGWRARSANPVNVVGCTLRATPDYRKGARGWVRDEHA